MNRWDNSPPVSEDRDLEIQQALCVAAGAASTNAGRMVKRALPRIAGLYRGVFGAASGAGIAIGAYFAFYGAATNVLVRNTQMKPASIAFTAGAIAAAGGSIVKVPLAVCIRSVQAGVYPNVIKAASEITAAAGESLCHFTGKCEWWRLNIPWKMPLIQWV